MMILNKLSEARGVSGNEVEVRRIIRREAKKHADEITMDALGNLIAVRHGTSDLPRLMVAAHMDEVGLMVSSIEKNGLLRFRKVGGIDDRVLPSATVRVGKDGVPGVIGAKPVHVQKPGERKKIITFDNMFIDIGAESKEQAEKSVELGDYATFDTQFSKMGDDRVKGKAFDDRAGCAQLLDLLAADHQVPLYAAFTVQEEIGLRGARVAAYRIDPDLALVLEGTTCADVPGAVEHGYSTTLGEGPALGLMDRTSIAHPGMLRELIRLAGEEDIPYQFRRSLAGGNDAGPIHLTRSGVPAATVSTPCRYIHSPVSMMKQSDYDDGLRLLKAFLHSIEEGFRP